MVEIRVKIEKIVDEILEEIDFVFSKIVSEEPRLMPVLEKSVSRIREILKVEKTENVSFFPVNKNRSR